MKIIESCGKFFEMNGKGCMLGTVLFIYFFDKDDIVSKTKLM